MREVDHKASERWLREQAGFAAIREDEDFHWRYAGAGNAGGGTVRERLESVRRHAGQEMSKLRRHIAAADRELLHLNGRLDVIPRGATLQEQHADYLDVREKLITCHHSLSALAEKSEEWVRIEGEPRYFPTEFPLAVQFAADQDTTETIEAPPSETPVDDEHIAILRALASSAPRILTISDLVRVRDCPASEKTVGGRLSQLIEHGLAKRPNGRKRGATITGEGRALLQRLASD